MAPSASSGANRPARAQGLSIAARPRKGAKQRARTRARTHARARARRISRTLDGGRCPLSQRQPAPRPADAPAQARQQGRASDCGLLSSWRRGGSPRLLMPDRRFGSTHKSNSVKIATLRPSGGPAHDPALRQPARLKHPARRRRARSRPYFARLRQAGTGPASPSRAPRRAIPGETCPKTLFFAGHAESKAVCFAFGELGFDSLVIMSLLRCC